MPACLVRHRSARFPLPAALAAIVLTTAPPARALAPGEDGARVFFASSAATDIAYAATIDPQGRVTLAGMSNSYSRIALARVAGFAADASFGSGGVITSPLSSVGSIGLRALTRMSDGRLVACGDIAQASTASDFLVARFSEAGLPDATFGGSGHVATAFAGTIGASLTDRCLAVAVQPDGSVLAAGTTAQNFGWNNVALLRYTTAGTLDGTFGTGGRVIINASANSSSDNDARAIALQPDGRILLAGSAFGTAANPDLLLMRFNANGTPDAGFGNGGRVLTNVGIDEAANAIVVQPDGRIVIAGFARPAGGTNRDVVVARYTASGVLDPSFGGTGVVTLAIGPSDDIAHALALMPWGRLVVAGSTRLSATASGIALAVAALNADGSRDRYFGIDGLRSIALGGLDATAHALATDLGLSRFWVVGTGDPAMTNGDLMAIEFGLPDTLFRHGFDSTSAP